MTYHDKLDNVLIALSKSNSFFFEKTNNIQSKIPFKIEHNELKLLLNYLVNIGYANCNVKNDTGSSLDELLANKYTYNITLQGLLFLEKSSFNNEIKILKRKNNWIVAKTIANILNAIIIVVIGIISVYVSIESNEDKRDNKILIKKIDSVINVNQVLEKKIADTTKKQ